MLLGGLLGYERGKKGRPAGLRTYLVVCLGSSLAMMTGVYLTQISGSGDAGRIAAQVISGIGFLGAGTILVTRQNQVKGLTTAAGLWAAACIGLALGIVVFFNHVAAKKLNTDPTPLEVEMRLYEDNISKTLIANADRKESKIDTA